MHAKLYTHVNGKGMPPVKFDVKRKITKNFLQVSSQTKDASPDRPESFDAFASLELARSLASLDFGLVCGVAASDSRKLEKTWPGPQSTSFCHLVLLRCLVSESVASVKRMD